MRSATHLLSMSLFDGVIKLHLVLSTKRDARGRRQRLRQRVLDLARSHDRHDLPALSIFCNCPYHPDAFHSSHNSAIAFYLQDDEYVKA